MQCKLDEFLETAALTLDEQTRELNTGHNETQGRSAEQEPVKRNEFKVYECNITLRFHSSTYNVVLHYRRAGIAPTDITSRYMYYRI